MLQQALILVLSQKVTPSFFRKCNVSSSSTRMTDSLKTWRPLPSKWNRSSSSRIEPKKARSWVSGTRTSKLFAVILNTYNLRSNKLSSVMEKRVTSFIFCWTAKFQFGFQSLLSRWRSLSKSLKKWSTKKWEKWKEWINLYRERNKAKTTKWHNFPLSSKS